MQTINLEKFTTHLTITFYDELSIGKLKRLEEQIITCIDDFEKEFSRFLPSSTLSRLNRWESLLLSPLFLQVIARTQEVMRQTEGAFHPFVSVAHIWYWTSFSKEFKATELEEEKQKKWLSLDLADYILLDTHTWCYSLLPWYALDLWWIGKGYVVDMLWSLIRQAWYNNFLINFWGDILVQGSKPDGAPFCVELDDGRWGVCGMIDLMQGSVSTSWSYKRTWKIDNTPYHHIINPHTWKNNRELISVSLIGPDTTTTDTFATAVMTWSVATGIDLLHKNHLDGLLISSIHEIHTTDNFIEKYNFWPW